MGSKTTMLIIFLTIFFIILYIRYLQNKSYYTGKPVENFNGKTFNSLPDRAIPITDEDSIKMSRTFVIKHLFFKNNAVDNKDMPPMESSIPTALVESKDIEIYLINHSTFLIQTNGLNIITDPVYSKIVGPYNLLGSKRLHAPAININDLPKIDVILLSHSHYDHMDLATIKTLYKKFKPTIIAPLGNDYYIKNLHKNINVITLNWDEKVTYKNTDFYLHKAYHWSKRGLFDMNKTLWGSFVINNGSKTIYFAGDTAFGDGNAFFDIKKQHNKIDLALIPIGAYKPNAWRRSHTNPQEAVEIFKRINATKALGMHTGTFKLSFETYSESILDLNNVKQEYKLNNDDFIVPIMGRKYVY